MESESSNPGWNFAFPFMLMPLGKGMNLVPLPQSMGRKTKLKSALQKKLYLILLMAEGLGKYFLKIVSTASLFYS